MGRARYEELLSVLTDAEREDLERLVDQFIEREVPNPSSSRLHDAANAFEDRGLELPPEQAVAALTFAALLRRRAEAANGH